MDQNICPQLQKEFNNLKFLGSDFSDAIKEIKSDLAYGTENKSKIQKSVELKSRMSAIMETIENLMLETRYFTEEKAMTEIDRLVEKKDDGTRGVDSIFVSNSLAFFDSEEAWDLREKLLAEKKSDSIGTFYAGLVGLDSPEARAFRKKIQVENNGEWNAEPYEVAMGISGLDTEEAWLLRKKLWEIKDEKNSSGTYKERINLNYIAQSLVGLNTDRAWLMREKLFEEEKNVGKGAFMSIVYGLKASLAGLNTKRAMAMRQKLIAEGIKPVGMASGINGSYYGAIAWRNVLKQKRG